MLNQFSILVFNFSDYSLTSSPLSTYNLIFSSKKNFALQYPKTVSGVLYPKFIFGPKIPNSVSGMTKISIGLCAAQRKILEFRIVWLHFFYIRRGQKIIQSIIVCAGCSAKSPRSQKELPFGENFL